MNFSYEIYDIGWANAFLEINSKKVYFSVSYLSDALKNLSEGIINLLPECVPYYELKKQSTFTWFAEPGGYVWMIESKGDDEIHIIIESYNDISLKSGHSIDIDETCYKIDFISCMLDQMDNILRTYGIIGYRETWHNHDFPISAYLKLKNYLMKGKTIQLEHIERYPGNEYSKTDLKSEIMLLSQEKENVS